MLIGAVFGASIGVLGGLGGGKTAHLRAAASRADSSPPAAVDVAKDVLGTLQRFASMIFDAAKELAAR